MNQIEMQNDKILDLINQRLEYVKRHMKATESDRASEQETFKISATQYITISIRRHHIKITLRDIDRKTHILLKQEDEIRRAKQILQNIHKYRRMAAHNPPTSMATALARANIISL